MRCAFWADKKCVFEPRFVGTKCNGLNHVIDDVNVSKCIISVACVAKRAVASKVGNSDNVPHGRITTIATAPCDIVTNVVFGKLGNVAKVKLPASGNSVTT